MKAFALALASLVFSFAAQAVVNGPYTIQKNANDTVVTITVKPTAFNRGDILFVIDDSASMDAYQQTLKKITPLIANTIASNLDSNVAVLTTSSHPEAQCMAPAAVCDGSFFGGVHNSQEPDFIANISKAMAPGTNGDPIEQPYSAIMAGLSDPLLQGANKNFLRPGADFFLVIVSDAKDQSTLKAEDVAARLRVLKPTERITTIAAIIPPSEATTCIGDDQYSNENYMGDLVNLTGGQVVSLCSDFASQMSAALQTSAIYDDHVNLAVPEKMSVDYSTLVVMLGKKALVAGDLLNGWSYDPALNQVVLSQGALQLATTQGPITVSYKIY